jgi:predicted NUDIX family phosphoesterase
MNTVVDLPLSDAATSKPPPASENPGPMIWVIATSVISDFLDSRSFYTGRNASAIMAALETKGQWYPRNPAETDPTFRQVIPYVLTSNQSSGKYLLMTRMKQQGEQRLHGKRYIGVGGHIEKEDLRDAEKHSLVKTAAWREIGEETGFNTGVLTFAGIICVTDRAAGMVDQVHIGVAYHLHTENDKISSAEADHHEAVWATADELRAAYGNMERWAQIICKDYLAIAP